MTPRFLRFMQPDELESVQSIADLQTGSHLRYQFAPQLSGLVERLPTFREGSAKLRLPPLRLAAPSIGLSVFRDVLLIGAAAVVDGAGRLSVDSVTHLGEAVRENLAAHASDLGQYSLTVSGDRFDASHWCNREPIGHIREPVFHFLYRRDQNYTHFMFDVLPKLAIHRSMPEPRPKLLVSEGVARKFMGLLGALGVHPDEVVVAPAQSCLRADVVYVATAPLWLHRPVVEFIRDAPGAPRPSGRRLYVKRVGDKAWHRYLLNEDRVVERLVARGFEVVVPESYDAAAQIALFQSAAAVVGHYGGGLLNAIFSATGTLVLSLTSTAYWRTALDLSVSATSFRAAQVVGDSFFARHDRNNSAFLVDLEAMDAACDELGL